MFFGLSKIFWALAQPLNFLCLAAVGGLILRMFREKAGQRVMNAALLLIVVFGVLPIGPLLLSWLERQYPVFAQPPTELEGIIVLGGAFESHLSRETGQIVANDQIERMFCFMKLAKENPNAKLVFSGGAGDIFNPDAMEGDDVRAFFALTGFDKIHTVLYEEKSRNTYENVLFTKDFVQPKSSERWAVTTSAYHMPRTVGIFEKLGWPVLPYSCDPKTRGAETIWRKIPNVAGNFTYLNLAVKELIGAAVYYATGKSAFILPSAQVPSSDDTH